MPQMAPLNWMSLFFIFLITFMMFCMIMYYTYTPLFTPKNLSNMKLFSKPLIWKW